MMSVKSMGRFLLSLLWLRPLETVWKSKMLKMGFVVAAEDCSFTKGNFPRYFTGTRSKFLLNFSGNYILILLKKTCLYDLTGERLF